MKLLLTVGAQMPFDRLVLAMDAWAAANPSAHVTAQVGDSEVRATHLHAQRFLEPAHFDRACDDADAIVGHAGIGTLFAALERGKPVLVLPRRADLRETRNDHQLATARRFGERPGVVVVWEERELPEGLERLAALVSAAPGVAEPARREGPLFDVIRDFVDTGALPPEGA
jgi:UDP-N-acetylglucosamine transferase subunit ALG13